MDTPFWYNIILQWRTKGMGKYGVSFPFLIGAIAMNNKSSISLSLIYSTFQEIINNPVEGNYCEVRWCGNINEPVVSIESAVNIEKKSIQAKYHDKNNNISLAFTKDLMSMLTLNCSTKEECLDKLIARTLKKVESGFFSKNNGVFGDFSPCELEFIHNVSKDLAGTLQGH